jgi:hypothetical protein
LTLASQGETLEPFVYAYKNHAANTRSNGWNLQKFEHEDFISEIAEFEYSGFRLSELNHKI